MKQALRVRLVLLGLRVKLEPPVKLEPLELLERLVLPDLQERQVLRVQLV